eukprot:1055312-Prymnesium_polylepis.1
MLPSGRRRAGAFDDGALPTARAFRSAPSGVLRRLAERVFRHRFEVGDVSRGLPHKTQSPSPVIRGTDPLVTEVGGTSHAA